ncbi:MAG: hypothetical protein ACRCSV_00075 [Chlamydiales bacterium]
MAVYSVMKDCNEFSGADSYFALQTRWYFCNSFYLYGDVSRSLLYGLFKTDQRDKIDTYSA